MMGRRRDALLAAAGMVLSGALPAAAPPNGLGWFAWQAGPWLADPQALLERLPTPSSRILLGLDAAQLAQAATLGGDAPILRLVKLASLRGVAVDLLLGDPEWVRPTARAHLMHLLGQLRHLPFAGLNLDIERGQLSGIGVDAWRQGLLETVRQARATTDWPLTLTTHADDLVEPGFLRHLSTSGAAVAIAMAYVSFPQLALERTERILRARAAGGAPLRIGLAQSIESQLARGESWHRFGRNHALREWIQLDTRLRRHAGFAGITIQSFEAFESASA